MSEASESSSRQAVPPVDDHHLDMVDAIMAMDLPDRDAQLRELGKLFGVREVVTDDVPA